MEEKTKERKLAFFSQEEEQNNESENESILKIKSFLKISNMLSIFFTIIIGAFVIFASLSEYIIDFGDNDWIIRFGIFLPISIFLILVYFLFIYFRKRQIIKLVKKHKGEKNTNPQDLKKGLSFWTKITISFEQIQISFLK